MIEALTDRASKAIEIAESEAKVRGADALELEHLIWGILKEGCGIAIFILEDVGLDLEDVSESINSLLGPKKIIPVSQDRLPLSSNVKNALGDAIQEMAKGKFNQIGTEHLLLAIFKQAKNLPISSLQSVSYESVRQAILDFLG